MRPRRTFRASLKKRRAARKSSSRAGKEPVAKIVPISKTAKKRIPGSMKGQLWSAPDAFDPLTDEELRELGFE